MPETTATTIAKAMSSTMRDALREIADNGGEMSACTLTAGITVTAARSRRPGNKPSRIPNHD